MVTLVPVHVASFDTRRASLSPDRLQYWAAWRLLPGRSDVPATRCCTWVLEFCNVDRWLQLPRHSRRQRTTPVSKDIIQHLTTEPFIRSPVKSFVLKQRHGLITR